MDSDELAKRNHLLIRGLGADLHALRAAVLALAFDHPDGAQLLRRFDAAATVLRAKKQGADVPGDWLDDLDAAIEAMRHMLTVAATGAPPG